MGDVAAPCGSPLFPATSAAVTKGASENTDLLRATSLPATPSFGSMWCLMCSQLNSDRANLPDLARKLLSDPDVPSSNLMISCSPDGMNMVPVSSCLRASVSSTLSTLANFIGERFTRRRNVLQCTGTFISSR